MNNLVKVTFKFIYYLFPHFIRREYIQSVNFYSDFIKKNIGIYNKGERIFKVKLVDSPMLLEIGHELLVEVNRRYSKISAPTLYVDNHACKRAPIEGKLSDVNVLRLSDVCVLGGTDALIAGDKMYHNELSLMLPIHDLKARQIFLTNENSDNSQYEYIVSFTNSRNCTDELVVSLLKEHSLNYYHWTCEVVPKFIKILSALKGSVHKLVILIDDGMPYQSVNMLEVIMAHFDMIEYSFMYANYGELILCSDLIYCTPLWTSLDNTRYIPNPKKEFFVAKDGLKSVRDVICGYYNIDEASYRNKRVYLQRDNGKLRKISNILEVERLLYKFGFDFIDPAALSFSEQYSLFSQADIILGASGAAFTNVLFMKENSVAINLYPSAQSTNYYVFQPLADVANVELIHFLTTPDDDSNSVHGDAIVNIEMLKLLLEEKCHD
jgi:hypothetical protein